MKREGGIRQHSDGIRNIALVGQKENEKQIKHPLFSSGKTRQKMNLNLYIKARKIIIFFTVFIFSFFGILKLQAYANGEISLMYFFERLHFYTYLFWFFSLTGLFFSWWHVDKKSRFVNKSEQFTLPFLADSKKIFSIMSAAAGLFFLLLLLAKLGIKNEK